MAIRFSVQAKNFEVHDGEKYAQWIKKVVEGRGKCVGRINYLFCDDAYVLDANVRFLNHDTYTDIITFDYVVGDSISGDIMISVDRVGENAGKYGVPFAVELRRVIIHGVLHLLGQGDKSNEEAAEMRRQEEEALGVWNSLFHEEQVV